MFSSRLCTFNWHNQHLTWPAAVWPICLRANPYAWRICMRNRDCPALSRICCPAVRANSVSGDCRSGWCILQSSSALLLGMCLQACEQSQWQEPFASFHRCTDSWCVVCPSLQALMCAAGEIRTFSGHQLGMEGGAMSDVPRDVVKVLSALSKF